MPTDRATVTAAARELLRALTTSSGPVAVRVTEADGRLACLVLVWEAGEVMPTAAGVRRRGERAGCRADILSAVREPVRTRTVPLHQTLPLPETRSCRRPPSATSGT